MKKGWWLIHEINIT